MMTSMTSERIGVEANSQILYDKNERIIHSRVCNLLLSPYSGITSIRKAFVVYGNNKLHMSSKSLKAVDRIVSVSVATQSGEEINLSNGFSNLVTIHYPNTVSNC